MYENFKGLSFSPADILLPKNCDFTRWAVVACDQYTSQPEYWQRVEDFVGDAPSTLRLILPESRLEGDSAAQDIQNVNRAMADYLENDQFVTYPASMIYVERTQQNGKVRRGLIGMVDLEEYDYNPGATTQIRATEGTVLSRIPPRVQVREHAPIELPHVMLLTDDPGETVIEPLSSLKDRFTQVYDFDLMESSGHLSGWLLDGDAVSAVGQALHNLVEEDAFHTRYQCDDPSIFLFAAGDGNHSLATAKTCYEMQKKVTPPHLWETLPARYALCELVNLHDSSLEFEPIHRIVTGVQPQALLDALLAAHPNSHLGAGEGHQLPYVTCEGEGVISIPTPTAHLPVATLQNFLDDYLALHPEASIDYIHGDDVTRQLAQAKNSIGFLLPAMAKDSLFPTVIFDGVLPRKTFSMGEAHDKRFYLEARKI